MDVVVTTQPAAEPLTIAEAREFLNLVDETGDESKLSSMIVAARQHAEMFTRRAFITRTLTGTMDSFPYIRLNRYGWHQEQRHPYRWESSEIRLPRAPLQSVGSVKYFDQNNALQTLDPSQYLVLPQKLPGRIALADILNTLWPVTYPRPEAVTIVWTAGFGADETFVPESLKLAMKYLIKHWWDRPDIVPSDGRISEIPFAARALLAEHTVEEFL